ncbi:MAG: response regulator transcription factor [Saccharothrix sp.]|nr:response regulator transcription factor [Saccharothrix sp.]
MDVVRVAVVDDHPVARYGVERMISAASDLVLVAQVAGAADLPRESGRVAADVIVCDLYLVGTTPALDTIADLAAHHPVLVMSASRTPADIVAAMQAGASGYLTKDADAESFVTAVRTVAGGEFHFSSQLADLVHAVADTTPSTTPLSDQERTTLRFIAQGFSHKQIANRMGISKSTVDTYIARIRRKLDLGNKAQLALAALRYAGPDQT